MDKWIETQQIISKERKDWQQGKEILQGRLELVKKEIATLEEKTTQAEASVAESDKKRNDLLAENEQLKAAGAQLTEAVTAMEVEVRRLFKRAPEPIQTKLQPLYQRIPGRSGQDPGLRRRAVPERCAHPQRPQQGQQRDHRQPGSPQRSPTASPAEVTAIYVGLAQAYYVSARGEAGIGRPTADGWKWEPSQAVARDVLTALEILQGKHSPAFVPLPVKLQPKP